MRGLCGGSGYQGSGRRYPEHPLVRSVLNGSSHVGEAGKATSPQGHGPGQPRSHCHSLCHGWMWGGDGDFGLGGSPSPARQDARLPRTVPLECRHRRAELQRQQLHVSRQVCGHQPAPGPLTACFQLQPEQGSVPPHHTDPGAAVPPGSSVLRHHGASPGTSRLWQHLSAHPLPCLQFCIIVHPLSNTCEQVKKPSHSSCHSSHSSRDAGSMGISWTLPAM